MSRMLPWVAAVAVCLSCTPLDPGGLRIRVAFPQTPRIQTIPMATRAVPILVASGGNVLDQVVVTASSPTAIFRGLPTGQVEVLAAAYDRFGEPVAVGKTNGLIEQSKLTTAQVDLQVLTDTSRSLLQGNLDRFTPFLELIRSTLATLPEEIRPSSQPSATASAATGAPTPTPTLNPGVQPPTVASFAAAATPANGFPTVLTATVSDPDSNAFDYKISVTSSSRSVSYKFDGANWFLTTPSVTSSPMPTSGSNSGSARFVTSFPEGELGKPLLTGDAFSVVWLAPTVTSSTTYTLQLEVSDGAQSATSNSLSLTLSPPATTSGSANVTF